MLLLYLYTYYFFLKPYSYVKTTEASLIQGCVKTVRIIALLGKGTTQALAILISSRTPPQVYSDLTIERLLPIDQDFKCNIST